MRIVIMAKEEKEVKPSKNSYEEDWKRDKWHIGRANYP